MKVLDLFSGIGGFSLGLERAGMETIAFCEIDPFCRKVLKKHWPDIPIYEDVRTLNGEDFKSVDLICGGYPCQPFSLAGNRRGAEDDRHLWPEVNRLIREIKPGWFIGENVAGHITMGLDQVLSDLESLGYTTETFVIPACAIDAPHRRDRVWIVANSLKCGLREQSGRRGGKSGKSAPLLELYGETQPLANNAERVNRAHNSEQSKRQRKKPREGISGSWSPWPSESGLGRVANGIPGRVDRLRALGNSVVPQIPELIGRAIMEIPKESSEKLTKGS